MGLVILNHQSNEPFISANKPPLSLQELLIVPPETGVSGRLESAGTLTPPRVDTAATPVAGGTI